MSAMKHYLDLAVARSLATGEPIPDHIARDLDDIYETHELDANGIRAAYPDDPWALALAMHREAHAVARGLGLAVLIALTTFAALVIAAIAPGTAWSALALAVAVTPLAVLIYRSLR